MQKGYYIGVDLGGTKICTALVNEEGTIFKEVTVPTEAEKGVDKIVENINDTIKQVLGDKNIKDILAIGIGSPGPLDVKNGLIVETPNLPFKNFNIVKAVKDIYDTKVFLDNDANAATLGEFLFGAGKLTTNMVYVTASTGVGGGAVLNGRIFRGSTSNAVEIGHTTVNVHGRRCGCGNRGCVEGLASGTAIAKTANEAIKSNAVTSLKKYDVVTSKEVFEESAKGDKVSQEILDEALSYLGILFANLANSYDPDVLVLGGGVSNGGEIVFEKINEEIQRRALKPIREYCKVKKAELGGRAGVLGAAALAITELEHSLREGYIYS
ncbi:ROK family protein [uncultured Clostridium sp.]|uniref:ROK family protein n=1 Tax=uncultured Clostridium sp. TaxID=59620 RepID=UPI002637F487|nr:ROK family protein [uncultured Clostridium sp.]